jgi:hypothetical protein
MDGQELRPAIKTRLAYLDQCFRWRGHANRSDLIERFGISPAQAAIDFRVYLQTCQEPAPVYDTVRKAYVASDRHVGLADPVDPPSSLSVIAEGAGALFDALPMPHRYCPDVVVRKLYQAMEQGLRIEIGYASMNSGEPTAQWIAPARIAFDGERLHFRAWSYRHSEWRDYLPVRVSEESSFSMEPPPDPLPRDEQWETRVRIELRPRADLSSEQQKAVRLEYGIEHDGLVIETREALAFYVDRRWGLNLPGARLERHTSGRPALD